MNDLITILNNEIGSNTCSYQADTAESQYDKDYYENEDKRRFHIVYKNIAFLVILRELMVNTLNFLRNHHYRMNSIVKCVFLIRE